METAYNILLELLEIKLTELGRLQEQNTNHQNANRKLMQDLANAQAHIGQLENKLVAGKEAF